MGVLCEQHIKKSTFSSFRGTLIRSDKLVIAVKNRQKIPCTEKYTLEPIVDKVHFQREQPSQNMIQTIIDC